MKTSRGANMAKRTKRGTIDKPEVLARLREGRRGALLVCATAKIDCDEYRAAERVAAAVDDLAGRLTGNAILFHAPPHISGED
jgi:hypothetical protein